MMGDFTGMAVVVAILGAATLAILFTNEGRQRSAAPPPTVLYDATTAGAVLVAHAHRLTGQPARVERAPDGSVTVIVDRAGPPNPVATPTETLRLAAEALVAEEALGVTVTRGILRHVERDVMVPFTPALRALVLAHLRDLRASEAAGPRLIRQDPAICAACAYRAMCAIGRLNASR